MDIKNPRQCGVYQRLVGIFCGQVYSDLEDKIFVAKYKVKSAEGEKIQ